MKVELGRKIMTKFVGLRAKTYGYLINHSGEDKKRKTYILNLKENLKGKIKGKT